MITHTAQSTGEYSTAHTHKYFYGRSDKLNLLMTIIELNIVVIMVKSGIIRRYKHIKQINCGFVDCCDCCNYTFIKLYRKTVCTVCCCYCWLFFKFIIWINNNIVMLWVMILFWLWRLFLYSQLGFFFYFFFLIPLLFRIENTTLLNGNKNL